MTFYHVIHPAAPPMAIVFSPVTSSDKVTAVLQQPAVCLLLLFISPLLCFILQGPVKEAQMNVGLNMHVCIYF